MNRLYAASVRQRPAHIALPAVMLLAGALTACSKPVEKTEDVRPVRVVKLAAESAEVMAEYAGEVKPRIESRLGFRVAGKIVARKVDAGSAVQRGQILMQLDPQDLQLVQSASAAAVKAAESNQALARAELQRYQELREKNFVSQAVLDAKQTAFQAAAAGLQQAQAAYRNQSNQTQYASLNADVDGVVTAIDAEIGQVVAPGTPVVRIARAGEKEVAIGIPEDKVERLRQITDVRIRLWAKPGQVIEGKLREIAPVADPATRTYAARISVPDAPADMKLGMTAYVAFVSKTAVPVLRLPLAALVRDKDGSAVWVVENGTVKLTPVQLGGPADNDILVKGGVMPGQTIVTAGVNLLKPGQKVRLLEEDVSAKTAYKEAGRGAAMAATALTSAGAGGAAK